MEKSALLWFFGSPGSRFSEISGFRDLKNDHFHRFPARNRKKNAKKIGTSKNEHKASKNYAIWDRFTMRTNISLMRHFEATYFDFRIFWWDVDVIKRWRIIDSVNIPKNVMKNHERNHLAFGKRTYRVGASLCAIKGGGSRNYWVVELRNTGPPESPPHFCRGLTCFLLENRTRASRVVVTLFLDFRIFSIFSKKIKIKPKS